MNQCGQIFNLQPYLKINELLNSVNLNYDCIFNKTEYLNIWHKHVVIEM